MKTKITFSIISIVLITFLAAPGRIGTAEAETTKVREQQIHINPSHYTVPLQKSDAARAIDAYERLMERYMDDTEQNFAFINADMQTILKKLDAIEKKVDKLTALSEQDNSKLQNTNSKPNSNDKIQIMEAQSPKL